MNPTNPFALQDLCWRGWAWDHLIGIAQGGNPLQWALHDGMGSTAYMEAANGSITANYQYTPTGQTFLASGGLQGWPFLFTGRDIGLDQNYYNRNRYYDPTLYRFMSPDPLSFGGGDTNLYAYVQNSPTNLTDPLGLSGGSSGGGSGKPTPPPPNNGKHSPPGGPCFGDCPIPTPFAEATTITEVGGPTVTRTPTPRPTPGPKDFDALGRQLQVLGWLSFIVGAGTVILAPPAAAPLGAAASALGGVAGVSGLGMRAAAAAASAGPTSPTTTPTPTQ